MRKQFGRMVLALACFLSGCDFIAAPRPPWLNSFLPSQRSYYYSSNSTYRHNRSSEHARSARRRYAARESGAAAAPDVTLPAAVDHTGDDRTAPPPAPAVSLSLAGDSGDRQRAQHLLQTVDANLVRARGRHLTAAEQETYQRASQLAHRARRALADNDCAAASSLAGKASSLAAGIGGD